MIDPVYIFRNDLEQLRLVFFHSADPVCQGFDVVNPEILCR